MERLEKNIKLIVKKSSHTKIKNHLNSLNWVQLD